MAFILGAANANANTLARLPELGTEPGFLTLSFERANPLGLVVLRVDYGDLTLPNSDIIPPDSDTLGSGVVVHGIKRHRTDPHPRRESIMVGQARRGRPISATPAAFWDERGGSSPPPVPAHLVRYDR